MTSQTLREARKYEEAVENGKYKKIYSITCVPASGG